MTFPPGAEDYYNVELAKELLEKELPDDYCWWRCVLCGYPRGVPKDCTDWITCGGCGQSTMRPIEEYETRE